LSAISCIVNPFTFITHYRHKISKKSTNTLSLYSNISKYFKYISKTSIITIDKYRMIRKYYI
jgi:flagellar assembly factor FliW